MITIETIFRIIPICSLLFLLKRNRFSFFASNYIYVKEGIEEIDK